MIKSASDSSPDLYLDFSQFNQMRKLSRDDNGQALIAAAKQMEGVFLNMMLQSMRDANAIFSEGNMLESRDSQFYQGMYDKQLALNISNNGGIGLADVIVRQMSAGKEKSITESSTDISQYLQHPVLARQLTESRQITEDESPDLQNVVAETPLKTESSPSPTQSSWNSPETFIEAIYPHASRAASRLGVSPEAIIAQAVLETGWGQHVMSGADKQSSYNLFGIKADSRWDGGVTRKNTVEYRNGIAAQENAAFRSYRSLGQAFDDYVEFLHSNSRYDSALQKKTEAKQWGYELQQSGYATDPNYGNKIANIMDSDVFKSALQLANK